jgi:hypothetical protein
MTRRPQQMEQIELPFCGVCGSSVADSAGVSVACPRCISRVRKAATDEYRRRQSDPRRGDA